MSSIIDEIFWGLKRKIFECDSQAQRKIKMIINQLNKINVSSKKGKLKNQVILIMKSAKCQYIVNAKFNFATDFVEIRINQLQDGRFKRFRSRHAVIFANKQITKRQQTYFNDSKIYTIDGLLQMLYQYHLNLKPNKIQSNNSKAIQLLLKYISSNILLFQQFVNNYLHFYDESQRKNVKKDEQFNQNLYDSYSLACVISNFDLSQKKRNYDIIAIKKKQQEEMIEDMEMKIADITPLQEKMLRAYCKLSQRPQRINQSTEYLKISSKIQQFRKMVKLPKLPSQEKKFQQYLYNTVKIQIKQIRSNPIGEGGSSQIFIAKARIQYLNSADLSAYIENQEQLIKIIAIKKMKSHHEHSPNKKFLHERMIVEKLKGGRSPYISKYYRTDKSNSEFENMLLMEYIPGVQLDKYSQLHIQTLSIWTKLCMLLNIIYSMQYLSNYDIVHLDLKPTNIVVTRWLVTKLIDFGQAFHPQVCKKDYLPGYTFPYAPPEIFSKNKKNLYAINMKDFDYSQKQDVYSFGIIMAQFLFDYVFFTFNRSKFYEIYSQRQHLNYLFLAAERSSDLGDDVIISALIYLIIKCLDPDPQKRPYFDWIAVILKLILNLHIND